jgi:hypothetical protein
MDVANRQITSHAMQISRSIKGGTRSGNSVATRPTGASYGDVKHNSHLRRPLSCSYCHGDTHTVEKCYFLNGFPVGHKLYGKNIKPKAQRLAAYSIAKETISLHDNKPNESPTFTTKEYNQLIALLHNRTGNFPLANATSIVTSTCNLSQHDPHSNIYWIMDSGASDHNSCSAPTHNIIILNMILSVYLMGAKQQLQILGQLNYPRT